MGSQSGPVCTVTLTKPDFLCAPLTPDLPQPIDCVLFLLLCLSDPGLARIYQEDFTPVSALVSNGQGIRVSFWGHCKLPIHDVKDTCRITSMLK